MKLDHKHSKNHISWAWFILPCVLVAGIGNALYHRLVAIHEEQRKAEISQVSKAVAAGKKFLTKTEKLNEIDFQNSKTKAYFQSCDSLARSIHKGNWAYYVTSQGDADIKRTYFGHSNVPLQFSQLQESKETPDGKMISIILRASPDIAGKIAILEYHCQITPKVTAAWKVDCNFESGNEGIRKFKITLERLNATHLDVALSKFEYTQEFGDYAYICEVLQHPEISDPYFTLVNAENFRFVQLKWLELCSERIRNQMNPMLTPNEWHRLKYEDSLTDALKSKTELSFKLHGPALALQKLGIYDSPSEIHPQFYDSKAYDICYANALVAIEQNKQILEENYQEMYAQIRVAVPFVKELADRPSQSKIQQ